MDSVTFSVTGVRPALPSSVSAVNSMSIVGRLSSFKIVPLPCPSAIAAFEAFDRSTVNVSSCSYFVSPFTSTVMFTFSCFAGIVTVPTART